MIEEIPYQNNTEVSKRSIIMTWEELHNEIVFGVAIGTVVGIGIITTILTLILIFS